MKYIHGEKLNVAFVPVRRNMYDPAFAWEQRDQILAAVEKLCDDGMTNLIQIDWDAIGIPNEEKLFNEGMLMQYPGVINKVAKYLKDQGADCIFFAHTNFGCEEVVGMLGKAMGLPTLLWGPRDVAPTEGVGVRQTDIQCGLFASSKALQRYGVKFTYIENCEVASPIFEKGFKDFLATAQVVKTFKSLRIGVILPRPKPFLTVMFNEGELLQKFGIEIVPITADTVMRRASIVRGDGDTMKLSGAGAIRLALSDEVLAADKALYEEILGDYIANEDWSKSGGEAAMKVVASTEAVIMNLAKYHGCDFMAVECWTQMTVPQGIRLCHMFGDLHERGLPTACETDVLGAVTSAILGAAVRGTTPTFFADLTIRHPENDNAELLWHCGPFARSLRKETEGKVPVQNFCGFYEIKHGPITVVRFEQDASGQYKLFAGEGRGVDGPSTNGNYVWFECENWPLWERKFVEGPYIHHVAGAHGEVAGIIKEACKYLPGVQFDDPYLPN